MCDIIGGQAVFAEQSAPTETEFKNVPSEIEKGNFSISLSHVMKDDEGPYTCKAPILKTVYLKLTITGAYGYFFPKSSMKPFLNQGICHMVFYFTITANRYRIIIAINSFVQNNLNIFRGPEELLAPFIKVSRNKPSHGGKRLSSV